MSQNIAAVLAEELNQPANYVQNVIDLIDEGNTIPFIARYRKERHGAMDDTTLRRLEERLKYLRSLQERREEILTAIDEQGKLTESLRLSIAGARTLAEVEELYVPYKQKRRTRAMIAREKGLEPLAEFLYDPKNASMVPELAAEAYVTSDDTVPDTQTALAGASDIIAEMISDSPEVRQALKDLIVRKGMISGKAAKKAAAGKDEASGAGAAAAGKGAAAAGKGAAAGKTGTGAGSGTTGKDGSVYELYMDFLQPVNNVKDHQILALNRGEKEGFLKVDLEIDREIGISAVQREAFRGRSGAISSFLCSAMEDSYDRLLLPSVKNQIRALLTERASAGAIRNFAMNLKPLLMQPPVRGSVTMGLDPGYRMGCKVAVVDSTGKVLDTAVVYPTHGERQKAQAIQTLSGLVKKHGVRHIAIGNGTASRETEQMTAELIRQCPGTSYMVVNEAGASVYSVSVLAAQEFPQYDVNLRSAVSIARRLQDPLAELVKIEPRSIGVGQYQHDVPQKQLEESLDAVVEDCVNAVGVDINTASESLLRRVSGLTASTAKNIVLFREENGAFTSRAQIKKVPRLGPKAFEQCAGFLRVPASRNFLDHTGVHPESYEAAEKLLKLCGYAAEKTAMKKACAAGAGEGQPAGCHFPDLQKRLSQYGEARAAQECGVGLPTLQDIAQELIKPGRDPRESLPAPIFRTDLMTMEDLKPGMVLTGTVRNVIDFGVFVDIGVHQDGLVHISEIADRFIRHPGEVLSVGQDVKVLVLDVDLKKKRISLSIRQAAGK